MLKFISSYYWLYLYGFGYNSFLIGRFSAPSYLDLLLCH